LYKSQDEVVIHVCISRNVEIKLFKANKTVLFFGV